MRGRARPVRPGPGGRGDRRPRRGRARRGRRSGDRGRLPGGRRAGRRRARRGRRAGELRRCRPGGRRAGPAGGNHRRRAGAQELRLPAHGAARNPLHETQRLGPHREHRRRGRDEPGARQSAGQPGQHRGAQHDEGALRRGRRRRHPGQHDLPRPHQHHSGAAAACHARGRRGTRRGRADRRGRPRPAGGTDRRTGGDCGGRGVPRVRAPVPTCSAAPSTWTAAPAAAHRERHGHWNPVRSARGRDRRRAGHRPGHRGGVARARRARASVRHIGRGDRGVPRRRCPT